RAATAALLWPSAHASTIRARSASPCAVFRRLAQFCNLCRSASDNTSGSSLLSPMPPAHRRPTAPSPPKPGLETKRDSRGDEETQDRDTSWEHPPTATQSQQQLRCLGNSGPRDRQVRTDKRPGPSSMHSTSPELARSRSESAGLRNTSGRQYLSPVRDEHPMSDQRGKTRVGQEVPVTTRSWLQGA